MLIFCAWIVRCHGTCVFLFSSRTLHTRLSRDWSSDVCSSDLHDGGQQLRREADGQRQREQQRFDQGRCSTRLITKIALTSTTIARTSSTPNAVMPRSNPVLS